MSSKKLFIHIPKNGGMTIRHSSALKGKIFEAKANTHKKDHAEAVREKMKKTNDAMGYEHARWRDIQEDITKNHKAFAIIRNPWDRVVSRYFFAKKVIEKEKKVPSSYANVSSFEEFLEERFKWDNEEYMWHRAVRSWYPAFDHVSDEDGNIRCDILRFESFNSDVCKYFNLREMTRARNVTGLNKVTYKDLYNKDTIQIVADWYSKDIETWGYDFDTGPIRNFYFSEER